jgi:hypothetical protein
VAQPPDSTQWKVLAEMESVIYDDGVAESPQLTAEQARAALDEADARSAQVRLHDRHLSWMLFVVAAAYLAAGAAISVSPHHGTTYAGVAVVTMLAAAIVAAVLIGLHIRAYSRPGIVSYFLTIIVFNLWNALIAGASIATRFWAMGQPSYHFGISVVVAVIPLVIGAWVIWRRR